MDTCFFCVDSGDFCNNGLWPDSCIFGGDVPCKDSIYIHVVALSYWQWNFGGLLPAVATYLVTKGKEAGHAEWFLEGLWYPIIVSAVCFIIGMIYLDSKNKNVE